MSDLCSAFRHSSQYVHKWLTLQPAVKEESITDWLLYDISRNAVDVVYVGFTRHEEARRTGADWEWWIVYSDGAVRIRVQAKRLFDAKDNYPEIARKNQHGLQIDKLLNDSLRVNAFPMYAFYHPNQSEPQCPFPPTALEGVHVAGARQVAQTLVQTRRFVSPGDALALGRPISCLVCCPVSALSATGLIQHIQRHYGLSDPSGTELTGYHETVPQFVMKLLDREAHSQAQIDGETSNEIPDVGSLLIIDRRVVPPMSMSTLTEA